MLIYFCVAGLISMFEVIWNLKIIKNKEKIEAIERYKDTLPFDLVTILYIFSMLFGFIIIPVSIAKKVYKLVTGKDLFSNDL